MRAWIVAGLLVLVTACSGGSSTHTIRGTITVPPAPGLNVFPNRCLVQDGYDDIDRGASIKVTNGSGNIVGTSAVADLGRLRDGSCVFHFVVKDVRDADFYTVKVSHRDGPAYSAKQLDDQGWRVGLSLG